MVRFVHKGTQPGPLASGRLPPAQRGAVPPWPRPRPSANQCMAPIGGYFPLYTNCTGPTNNFHAVMSGRSAEMRPQLAVKSNAANVSKRSIERVIPMTDGEVGRAILNPRFCYPHRGSQNLVLIARTNILRVSLLRAKLLRHKGLDASGKSLLVGPFGRAWLPLAEAERVKRHRTITTILPKHAQPGCGLSVASAPTWTESAPGRTSAEQVK